MINIMGKNYITDKEAAQLYGYSRSWFILQRHKKKGPKFVKLNDRGKILYPVHDTDEYFKKIIAQEIF